MWCLSLLEIEIVKNIIKSMRKSDKAIIFFFKNGYFHHLSVRILTCLILVFFLLFSFAYMKQIKLKKCQSNGTCDLLYSYFYFSVSLRIIFEWLLILISTVH